MSERGRIRRLGENCILSNRFITLFDDDVSFGDGSRGRYLRIVESGGDPGVAALALCAESIALVRAYRYPIGAWEWGIPRGFAHGQSSELSIRAELVEELGQEPEHLEPLGTVTPNSGLLASVVCLFIATYRTPVTSPASKEISETRWATTAQVLDEIRAGHIIDGFTLAAVGLGLVTGVLQVPAVEQVPSPRLPSQPEQKRTTSEQTRS
jgi:hypothetical protein